MSDIERIRDKLCTVVDPCSAATGSNLDVVEMGLIKSIDIEDGHVEIAMRLTTPSCHMLPYFFEEIEGRVSDIESVESVTLETDGGFEWHHGMMSDEAKAKRQKVLDEQERRFRQEQSVKEMSAGALN